MGRRLNGRILIVSVRYFMSGTKHHLYGMDVKGADDTMTPSQVKALARAQLCAKHGRSFSRRCRFDAVEYKWSPREIIPRAILEELDLA